MRRSRRRKKPEPPLVQEYLANDRITAPEVRVIDADENMIGVLPTAEAIAKAEAAELDLVEVSPKAQPPVCRIMDYGSFKYQKEKEARARKVHQKATDTKGIRLSFRISEHDLEVRRKAANKFLEGGNKVKLELNLRGREKQHFDQAKELMESFAANLETEVTVEQPVSRQGGKLSMIIAPKK